MHKNHFRNLCLVILAATQVVCVSAQKSKTIAQKVDSVLQLMTLEEKIGQLNQYSGDWSHTGPITKDGDKQSQIKKGQLGSMLNIVGVEHTRTLQELAMQSRLKIPLLFGQDVIHGLKTTFPIPLAEAASWDLPAIERSARTAAKEATASGIHWTFAPMVDIARDPRWGRVMEGAGEDPFLGSAIAKARVKGFQGNGLGSLDAVMACAKHFAAYGAAVGGRDYNSVDMSERLLHEVYLPPFKAALDAGVATFMNSFNDLNGVPATGNRYLQRTLLKEQWKFKGFVVSDWGSVGEMIAHGYVQDNREAAKAAITAGSDMDMESRSYIQHLAELVKQKQVSIALVDDAVRRILAKKFEMGLFDDPFRFSNADRERKVWNDPAHKAAALDMARKSIVLLKNEQALLPIQASMKKVALIGPFMKAVRDNLGFWSYEWPDDSTTIVTQYDGIVRRLPKDAIVHYAKGCNINDADSAGFAAAIAAAKDADLVIMSMGEARDMSGEAKSRSSIQLPGVQEALIKAIHATGKPVVLLMNAGRPLIFNWAADHVPAIVYTWWLGTQAGDAIGDVLFGQYNPSGKLPMTFPRSEGQIPIYYNYYNTGRPAKDENNLFYVSAYIDLPNSPKYPFGYGLSYTQFQYAPMQLSDTVLKGNQTLTVKVRVRNAGKYDGEEVVQLYLRDVTASVVRPVKELKGFQKIFLKAGETKELVFKVKTDDLRFYNQTLQHIWEPGEFHVMVGTSSAQVETRKINWQQ
ncbi:MAG: beta-glucosidase BglX [Chitinophagales bacterium]|nr:beta-glucosidase BglX [Chitinophagales bacterium]